jgi:hypothetical protein
MSLFYLQVRRNHLTLKSLDTQKSASATAAFTTQRLLVGEFFIANSSLYHLVAQVCPGFINQLKRRHLRTYIVVHAQEMLEGGLCPVEHRVLQEIVVQGFRKAHSTVYADPQQIDDETVKQIIRMKSREVITASNLIRG